MTKDFPLGVYNACVPSVMLDSSKLWALNTGDFQRLKENDVNMPSKMCNICVHK